MVPIVTTHAWRQRWIELPKPRASKWPINGNPTVSGDRVVWKMTRVSWGTRFRLWYCLNPAKSTATKMGWARVFQASIDGVLAVFWRWWQQGYDRSRSSFRSVPSLTRTVAEKWEFEPGQFRGSGWVKRVNLSSLAHPLFFLFWKLAPLFPFIETSFFFSSLLPIKLMPDPCWNKIRLHTHWIVFELSQFYVVANLK